MYGPQPARPSKLDAFEPYIEGRLVWNGPVLLGELWARGFSGGYTILKDWLHRQRSSAQWRQCGDSRLRRAIRRRWTGDNQGSIDIEGQEHKLNGFTFTLGYRRTMMAEAALDQKLGTLLKMHEEAFRQLGGVPEEILYDRSVGGARPAMCPG